MTHEDEIRKARAAGREEGAREPLEELRVFTGLDRYLRPESTEPEHLSYFGYEADLENALRLAEERFERAERMHQTRIHQTVLASTALEEVKTQRRAERVGKNPLSRAFGAVGDQFLVEEQRKREANRHLNYAIEERDRALERCDTLTTELKSVRQWLDQMLVDVDSARSARQARHDQAARDLELAQRDVSSSGFRTYSAEAFLREDPRRASSLGAVVDGYQYGGRWRRDEDDGYRGDGNWMLWWLEATHETVLELRGPRGEVWLLGTAITSSEQAQSVLGSIQSHMTERNSVAVVLETYRAIDDLS